MIRACKQNKTVAFGSRLERPPRTTVWVRLFLKDVDHQFPESLSGHSNCIAAIAYDAIAAIAIGIGMRLELVAFCTAFSRRTPSTRDVRASQT